MALTAFDMLGSAGVDGATRDASPLLACFRTEKQRQAMATELAHMAAAGQPVVSTTISGDDARTLEPCLSDEISAAIAIEGQRFVDPFALVTSLANSLRTRGATLRLAEDVTNVTDAGAQVLVSTVAAEPVPFDAAVIATGAWLNRLAKPFGVPVPVHAGRGYSFSVEVAPVPTRPLYFPVQRVACTPIHGTTPGRRDDGIPRRRRPLRPAASCSAGSRDGSDVAHASRSRIDAMHGSARGHALPTGCH